MVWVVPVLIWLVWGSDRPAGGRLWAAGRRRLFWWAPIWHVPNGANVELSEHGWQLVWGNSFFYAMVVFMVGISVMLTVRRHRDRRYRYRAMMRPGWHPRTDHRRNLQPARCGHRHQDCAVPSVQNLGR